MVQGGSNSGIIIPLSGRPITMGRRSDNDVVVDETTVSRRHALILEGPDGFLLRDLSTTNGTYVNRDRIGHGEHRLHQGPNNGRGDQPHRRFDRVVELRHRVHIRWTERTRHPTHYRGKKRNRGERADASRGCAAGRRGRRPVDTDAPGDKRDKS